MRDKMRLDKILVGSEREELKSSFGFKGSALSYLTQTAVAVYADGDVGVGEGVQSVLWSDARVYSRYGEDKGNELMLAVTEYAAGLADGIEFEHPCDVINAVFSPVLEYAKRICDMEVSETFVLNALVPLDLAIWSLYARRNGFENFDRVLSADKKQKRLANIPLITYSASVEDAIRMAKNGTPLFKIKIGSDPYGDGDPLKMLEWDKARALEIHRALCDIETDLTETGRIAYYFDANGRYDTRERLEELLRFLDENGILERTVLLEEPFPQDREISVKGLPVCVAADESAHSVRDVKRRIELGYSAITLKPIAKTLSVTLEMLKCAEEMGVQCFCADLTVNPVMIEWNKCVAARLKPLRGMKIGVVESNGAQNYNGWERMLTYLEKQTEEGALLSPSDSADVFKVHEHYLKIATRVAENN